MPTSPTYPGVYIEEVPSGVRTITGVATSIAAFVGYFSRGPMNVAVRIFSFGDFEREFGGLRKDSEASYAIQQFFLNGGGQVYVIRTAAGVPEDSAAVTLQDDSGADVLTLTARAPGTSGNEIRIDVDYNTTIPAVQFNLTVSIEGEAALPTFSDLDPSNLAFVALSINAAQNIVTASVPGGAPSTRPAQTGTTGGHLGIGDPPPAQTDDTVDVLLNGLQIGTFQWGTSLVTLAGVRDRLRDLLQPIVELGTVTVDAFDRRLRILAGTNNADDTVTLVDNGGTVVSTLLLDSPPVITNVQRFSAGGGVDRQPAASTVTLLDSLAANVLVATASNEGVWGDSVAVTVDYVTADPATQFNLTAAEAGGKTEVFRNLVLDAASSGYALDVVNAGSKLVRLSLPDPNIPPAASNRPAEGGPSPLTGGDDGALPGGGELSGIADDKTGMYALLDVDLFNILCLPDTMRLATAAAAQVASAATAFCEQERAFYILDAPQPANPLDEPDEIQQWLDDNATLRHRNAALYYPRPSVPDALNDFRLREVAPSGTMAGVYARTDGTRGVWKAPAGTEAVLRGAQRLEYKLTDAENGVINPLGINALRTMPVFGNVAWGARTLDGADQLASEWKYIPVRRLALFLEESLYRGTQWVVFEPNDEPLWAQIRLNLGSFMHNLFRQGAFQGMTPKDAYFVKCDSETTTQSNINQGIVNIVVGFAPLKPAEFVIIKLQQIAGQLET